MWNFVLQFQLVVRQMANNFRGYFLLHPVHLSKHDHNQTSTINDNKLWKYLAKKIILQNLGYKQQTK